MHAKKIEETRQLNFDAALAEIDRQERAALADREVLVAFGMSTALVDAALRRLMDQRIALAQAYLPEVTDDIPASAQPSAVDTRGTLITLTTLMLMLATVVAVFAGVV